MSEKPNFQKMSELRLSDYFEMNAKSQIPYLMWRREKKSHQNIEHLQEKSASWCPPLALSILLAIP